MKIITMTLLSALLALSASAEKTYKYRVNLKDKVGTSYTVDKPVVLVIDFHTGQVL